MDKLIRLENNKKDISGLVAEIDNLINSEIGHLFDCSRGTVITLEKAYKEKAIVYFCLSPLAFPGYANTLGKLIINDLKSLMANNITHGYTDQIYTIFDEFSVFAGDQIVNLINQGRSSGVCAVLATQSLSDISAVGGQSLVGQILNNCNNYIIHRQNNPMDPNILADIIGTKDAYKYTKTLLSNNTQSDSISKTKEYIVHPEDIKMFKKGYAVVVNKTQSSSHIVKIRQGAIQ